VIFMEAQKEAAHDGSSLTVTVLAPNDPRPKTFTWPKTLKVGDAAKHAATQFGFSGGNPTFMNSKDQVLRREETLQGAHVRDGDRLELVDVGGGV
jgi:hypothetical protein